MRNYTLTLPRELDISTTVRLVKAQAEQEHGLQDIVALVSTVAEAMKGVLGTSKKVQIQINLPDEICPQQIWDRLCLEARLGKCSIGEVGAIVYAAVEPGITNISYGKKGKKLEFPWKDIPVLQAQIEGNIHWSARTKFLLSPMDIATLQEKQLSVKLEVRCLQMKLSGNELLYSWVSDAPVPVVAVEEAVTA